MMATAISCQASSHLVVCCRLFATRGALVLSLIFCLPTQNAARATTLSATADVAHATAHDLDCIIIKPSLGATKEALARFHSENRCEVLRDFPGFGDVQVLRVPEGGDVQDVIRRYRDSSLVEFAEPDYRVQLAGVYPNDLSFLDGTQWGLNNAGQDGGLANADIDAPEGWSALTSASNVIVAVVDSGIRYTHEDLVGNMWTNLNDGSHGINAITGTTDPNDDNGHGTSVAGVIGAVGNNGLGVVGVAWRVQLMACKFTDESGNGSVSDALTCLDFALTNGAHIVNASWGLDEYSLSLSNAINTLRLAGIIVAAAAGNNARDIDLFPRFPASYDLDNILAVAATTRRDEFYPLSNLGATNVDLAAPGHGVYSTGFQSDNSYAFDEGTSIAAAYASGASALVRAMHTTDTPAQIISRLLAAVDPKPSLDGRCVSGGRLNLRRALDVAVSVPLLKAALGSPNGPFVLSLSGDPGRNYVLEATTDLLEWWPASTNLTGLTGYLVMTNNLPASAPRQLYRARLDP